MRTVEEFNVTGAAVARQFKCVPGEGRQEGIDSVQCLRVTYDKRYRSSRDPGKGFQNDLGAYSGRVAYRYSNPVDLYIFTSMYDDLLTLSI